MMKPPTKSQTNLIVGYPTDIYGENFTTAEPYSVCILSLLSDLIAVNFTIIGHNGSYSDALPLLKSGELDLTIPDYTVNWERDNDGIEYIPLNLKEIRCHFLFSSSFLSVTNDYAWYQIFTPGFWSFVALVDLILHFCPSPNRKTKSQYRFWAT